MSIVRTVALRRLSVAALLFALSLVGMARDGAGQGLGYAILARYFDALRQQVGIPGMSAAVVQSGQVVWEAGFGQSQVGQGTPATPSTPYPILGLSQTVAATIVLDCAKPGLLELDDPIRRWSFELPEVDAEVREILSHTSNGALNGAFQFDPARFAVLNPVLEWCLDQPYALGLASQVFDRLGMSDSVPSHDLGQPASAVRGLFPPARLTSYLETLGRVASPYQTQGRGIVEAGQYLPASLDATGGIVSSVRDLARFDVGVWQSSIRDAELARPGLAQSDQREWDCATLRAWMVRAGSEWSSRRVALRIRAGSLLGAHGEGAGP